MVPNPPKMSARSRRRGVFSRALLASIGLHVLVIVAAGGLLSLFRISFDQPLPKVLRFAFVPEAADQSGGEPAALPEPAEKEIRPKPATRESPVLSDQMEESVSPAQRHTTPEADRVHPREAPNRRHRAPLTSTVRGPAMTETSPQARDIPVSREASLLRSTFAFDPLRKHAFLPAPLFDRDYRLMPAKLTIPARERKRIEKRVMKYVKKLDITNIRDSTFSWKEDGQYYEAKIRYQNADTPQSFDEVHVEVRMGDGERTYKTEMQFRRLAFSHFAQFVDFWDPYVAIHDDEFDGRFHTNSHFKISTSGGVHPKFKGKVTASGYIINPSNRFLWLNPDSIFLAGVEVNTDIIRFPKKLDQWLKALTAVDSLCQVFETETWIVFHPDGSFSWREEETGRSGRRMLPSYPFSIVGKDQAILHVKGVVKGKVLVYSPKKIIIDGNLTYTQHPAFVRGASDYLGLVSERDIEIAHPKVTGPGDLYIQAAILAKRYFRVRKLYAGSQAVMHIYGSLSAGSISATEPRYATRIRFDRRLEKRRPPFFPMTNRFELAHWDGKWQLLETTQ